VTVIVNKKIRIKDKDYPFAIKSRLGHATINNIKIIKEDIMVTMYNKHSKQHGVQNSTNTITLVIVSECANIPKQEISLCITSSLLFCKHCAISEFIF
jgi:hypothetical protein